MCRIQDIESNVNVFPTSKKKQVANSKNIKMHTKPLLRSQNNSENLVMMDRICRHYYDLSSDERQSRPSLLRKSASMDNLRDVIDTDVDTNHDLNLSDHFFQLLKGSKWEFLLDIDGKEHLQWYRRGIATKHSKFIANRLVNNFNLLSLDISYNREIGDRGIFYLCMALEQNSTLKNLNLDATGITDVGAADIAALFSSTVPLTVLGLSQNEISYDGMDLISKALENNTTLRTLRVDQMTDDNSSGKKKPVIEINYLSGNEFKKGSMSFDIYKEKSKSICLYRKNFNTYHMIIATPMLAKNHLLTDLNISHNAIGDAGIEYFSKMLATNETIAKLNLSNCMISDSGVKYIADALEKNFVLVNLNIARNTFTKIGVHFLSFALKENKANSLHSLTLTKNFLNIQQFRGNASELNCHRKRYNDFDAIIIASLLVCNASLETLILSENDIGDEGAKALAKSLNCNSVLQFLNLSKNMIGHLGVSAMKLVRSSLDVSLKNMRISEDKCSVS